MEQLELLFESVEKLPNGGRAGLARDMLTYVLYGDAVSVLHEVGQSKEISDHLHLTASYGQSAEKKLSELYRNFEAVPVSVALRWAHLLDACVPTQFRRYYMQFPDGINWPETLLMHSTGCSLNSWSSSLPVVKDISFQLFERLLVEAGIDASLLIVTAFSSPVTSGYGVEQRLRRVADLIGYTDAFDRHIEEIRPLLQPTLVQQRLHVLAMLEKAEPKTLEKLAPELSELVVSSSKQVRAAAEAIVSRCGTAIVPPLQHIACKGKPDQRVYALRLLYSLAINLPDDSLQAFARDTAQADKAPSVNALIEEWRVTQSAADIDQQQRYEYDAPSINWSGALTPQLSKLLD